MPSISKRAMSSTNGSRMQSSAITNQSQGGGSKKAGFPYQVGRSTWTSIAFNAVDPVHGKCCKLNAFQMTFTKSSVSRPIGSTYTPNTYFHIPGTR